MRGGQPFQDLRLDLPRQLVRVLVLVQLHRVRILREVILREVQDLRADERFHRARLLMAIEAACPASPSAAGERFTIRCQFHEMFLRTFDDIAERKEVHHIQRGAEAGRAGGRQRVVRSGNVVAQGFGCPLADEDRARIADLARTRVRAFRVMISRCSGAMVFASSTATVSTDGTTMMRPFCSSEAPAMSARGAFSS